MKYVYCLNYLALFFVFRLRDEGHQVAIITPVESIRRYCQTVHIKCHSLDLYATENLPGLLSGARLLLSTRKYLDRFLESLNLGTDDSFYATGYINDYACWYMAKQWAKRGKVYVTNDLDTVEWRPFEPGTSPHLQGGAKRIERARWMVR
ncbi:MAG: hypothetical protein HY678_03095, partial [Chloroflexi bacterium]|nr:hypothetical protein [Chloroflexota bacterium]